MRFSLASFLLYLSDSLQNSPYRCITSLIGTDFLLIETPLFGLARVYCIDLFSFEMSSIDSFRSFSSLNNFPYGEYIQWNLHNPTLVGKQKLCRISKLSDYLFR